jgi:adhesin/invasin
LSAVLDHDDGTYTAVLTSTMAGQAIITGELDGNPIADNAIVTFRAGPPAPGSATISAAPDSAPADGASPVTITVRLLDANGNPLTASGGTVVLGATLGSLSTVTDHDDGTYTATLTSSQAGTALLSGLLDGVPIADTATVAFLAGPASPVTSTIRADPRRVPADPAKGTVIWVRLFDAQGNRLTISGGTVTLATTLGTLGPVVDRGDGTYTATLQSSVPGRAVVSGTLNGVPMTASDDVWFVSVTGTP